MSNFNKIIHVQIHKYLVIFIIAASVMACQGTIGGSAPGSGQADRSKPNGRAYYYYTAAQLKFKQGDVSEAIWHLKQALRYDPGSDFLKLELANLLSLKNEETKALELIRQVLKAHPNSTQALSMAGRIYQQQNKLEDAVAAYEKILKGCPTDLGTYLMLGRIYWNSNRLGDAERVFETMTKQLPDSNAAYYFYGKALAAQGKLAMAEKALLKCIDLEPSLEEPQFELLKIYESQNQHQKAIRVYRSILANNPDNVDAALGLAEQYHKIEMLGPSLALLKELGRKVQSDDTITATLFERYLETKRFDEALWMICGMLKTAGNNSDLHYMAGIAYNGIDQDEKALLQMSKVRPGSRFYTNAVVHRALIYHDAGRIDRAIKVVHTALAHQPDNIDYYLYLGSFYEELERYRDALEVFQEGLAKDNTNGRLYFRAGVVYDKMGRKDQSIAAMKNVLRLTPNDAEALNYLGYTYADMGINLDEAEMLIQSALKIKPDDGYITDSLGWVYYKRGDYGRALKLLIKAVSMIPDDPVILEHLGDVYYQMNSKENALNYYRQSLKKKTSGRDVLEKKVRALTHPQPIGKEIN
jgi:tetratricopeptide (TPR) repeat protein